MSFKGEVNKISGDVRRAVNAMAKQGVTSFDGAVRGTKKIWGYVCAINKEGEFAGTVDVQEFNYEPDEYVEMGTGHHKGVYLSAIQDNKDGLFIIPMLYSEVVITQNPTDGTEYVIMYSHAQHIRMTANSIEGKNDGIIEIGVTEKEKFVETDDGLDKDYDELEPTKNQTVTTYTATAITDKIISPDNEDGFKQEKTADHKIIVVGDTKITIDGQSVVIEATSCEVKGRDITVNGQNVNITGGKLQTKGASSTDLNGPFNAIKVCPFSGAPHCGSIVSGT